MKKIILLLFVFIQFQNAFAQSIDRDHVDGQVLVSVAQNADIQRVIERLRIINNTDTDLKIVRKIADPMNIWLLAFDPEQMDEEDMLYFLRSQSEIQVAQYNHILSPRNKTPNDSLYGNQWHWAKVQAEQAWDITTGGLTPSGDTIVVAIIDSGVDLKHPDLANNVWVNRYEIPDNTIDDDGNGYVDDYFGWNYAQNNDEVDLGSHGVAVNGMVGAIGNNKIGVSGMNWNVKMMNIAPFPKSTDESTVLAAYSYAYTMRKMYNTSKGKKGAFVVATNLSWGKDYGNPLDAPLWCSFYDTLGKVGIISCGATTNNSGINVDVQGDLPTACPSKYMLSVQMSDKNDLNKSGFGKTTIDVAAPGFGIFTTSRNGSKYATTTGTSFASPLVAGLVALAYASPCLALDEQSKKNPAAAALVIKNHILNSVDKVAALGDFNATSGRVNAFKTLQSVANFCSACEVPTFVSGSASGADVKISLAAGATVANVNYRFRKVGASTWIEVLNEKVNFVFSKLENCTDYEFQFQSNCADGTKSPWSSSEIFKTGNCCIVPTIDSTFRTKNSISVFWTNGSSGTFSIRYRKGTTGNFTTIDSIKSPYIIKDLDSCTNYQVQIRKICADGTTTAWTTATTFKTFGCGNCLDLGYCVPSTFSATFEYIRRVKIANINQASTGAGTGFASYVSGKKMVVNTGSSYPLQIIPGFSSTTTSVQMYIVTWIDYNQNGVFEDSEKVSAPNKSYGVGDTLNTVVSIPWDVPYGNTRMRVGARAYFSPPAQFEITNCDKVDFYGEFEDYCVDIVNGFVPCAQVKNLKLLTNPTKTVVSWDTVPGAISYNIQYRKFGQVDWKIENKVKGPYEFGIEPCVEYEVQVRTVCQNDLSDFTPIQIAKYCTVNTKETDPLLTAINVYPMPFQNTLTADFSLLENSSVKVEVYNSAGQLMDAQQFDNLDVNRHQYKVEDTSPWASGIYLLKFTTNGGSTTKKIIKVN